MDFSNIEPDDIMFQTNNISILKPHIKKGILICTNYNKNYPNIPLEGLKSRLQLVQEGLMEDNGPAHRCIFFRAPFIKPDTINYESIQTEIESLYIKNSIKKFMLGKIFIRVDPRNTYTFSSEIRDIFTYPEYYKKPYMIQNSRKMLLTYLDIIKENKMLEEKKRKEKPISYPIYNLFSSKVEFRSIPIKPSSPFNKYNINTNTEVLVETNFLSNQHFVTE